MTFPDMPAALRRWVPVAALGLGLALGGLVGALAATSDPTASAEYQALRDELQVEVDAAERSNARLLARAQRAEGELPALERRAAELDNREATVAARESAVSAVEQRIAATSIGEGIWTVGVDVEPGTYRTAEPLTGYCYWAILRSGTNGSDIVDNDGPEGGVPTVTLSEGQDFENSGCGTFVKQ